MSTLPRKFVVDTNVPKTANLAINPNKIPKELTQCVYSCVEAVEHIIKKADWLWIPRMKSLMNTEESYS
jgi:hypothetical protein